MRILDLFCGAGGASVGYYKAGFDVVGVDINPQKNYPFDFHCSDAITFDLSGFDVIHASPPCQAYSTMGQWSRNKNNHPDLVGVVREILKEASVPYIIENVPGSPLINPLMLCGSMFGLSVIRHRLFEFEPALFVRGMECNHSGKYYTVLTKSCRPSGDMYAKSSVAAGRIAMGIDWMTQFEMGESIPPAYTEYIGKQIIKQLKPDNNRFKADAKSRTA